MTMCAKGVAKLIEECGELQQVLGKRLAWWNTDEPHWDGSDLRERMVEEMGDVMAAIDFVADQFDIGAEVETRALAKRALFDKWESQPDNNANGISEEGAD